jgi:hypothetical protein
MMIINFRCRIVQEMNPEVLMFAFVILNH